MFPTPVKRGAGKRKTCGKSSTISKYFDSLSLEDGCLESRASDILNTAIADVCH